ncbi:MAG: DUF6273 domain-containing protein [Lachnospiraceae bacterium]|nr:DUF6273 domain-containing protein [Lachnospiraceae bacterium]
MYNSRPRIYAVDFDGTLCENKYPDIGAPIPRVIEFVKRQKADGNIVILWTCRAGRQLADAVTWCKNQGLIFDYINENVKENVEMYGGDTRKVFADVYIDDKTLLPQQIIIKESNDMTNKEKQELTNAVATAVITEIDDAVANYIADIGNDSTDAVAYALDAVATKYGVTYRRPLEMLTWSEIAEIAKSGKAAAHFRVGDTKDITLKSGETVTAVIVDFNHDVLDSEIESTAGITFGIKGVLDGWFEMNADDTNKGGWAKSKMRTVYMQRIENLLPDDVRAALQPVVKTTTKGGGSDDIEMTVDKLFLFSEVEIVGTDAADSGDDEGVQYKYFEKPENRVKHRDNGSACSWWLRSPSTTPATAFCCVISSGAVPRYPASGAYGVSFGFCL